MSNASKVVRREDLTKGGPVYVITKIGNALLKRKRGRVVDVLRAAAVVDQIDGQSGAKTIRFSDLELCIPGAPALPEVERLDGSPVGQAVPPVPSAPAKPLRAVPPAFGTLERPQARQQPQEQRRRIVPSAGVEAKPKEEAQTLDVAGWIAQGASMREKVNDQVRQIQIDLDTLTTQQLELEERVAAKKKDLAKAETLLAALDQLGGAVGS